MNRPRRQRPWYLTTFEHRPPTAGAVAMDVVAHVTLWLAREHRDWQGVLDEQAAVKAAAALLLALGMVPLDPDGYVIEVDLKERSS